MKYKLVPGKWCTECCFGKKNENGITICQKGIFSECSPGKTIYKEISQTNGDRIRAMSNEELAEYLYLKIQRACPPGYGVLQCSSESCEKCWLNWLNAEAKEE